MTSATSTTPADRDPYKSLSTITPFNWNCPHCDRATTITNSNAVSSANVNTLLPECGGTVFISTFIKCPNQDCNKISLIATENRFYRSVLQGYVKEGTIRRWQLIPESKAKTWPDYIPKSIREDYSEACLICELSPKASATLSRRCLQGIIRNVWGVKAGNLIDEIKQIEEKISPEALYEINLIRKTGNIGAHMEKDASLVIDIDPDEARLLIELIESLIKEWYIDKHERKKRAAALEEKTKKANLKK
ncbi:DUF4145 domain-containing protein [Lautropia mirabilis]